MSVTLTELIQAVSLKTTRAKMSDCTGKINLFCYICGKICIPRSENFTATLKTAYTAYFNQPIIENDYVPEKVCGTCFVYLINWWNGKREKMPFGVPMIWTNPGEDHDNSNCYACANDYIGLNRKKKNKKIYIGVQSAQLPLPHSNDIPVPRRPSPDVRTVDTAFQSIPSDPSEFHSLYEPEPSTSGSRRPRLVSRDDLDEMVADLNLPKKKAERLASFFKQRNFSEPGVNVTAFRKREKPFVDFYTLNTGNTYVFCHNIDGLMLAMGIRYSGDDWRLFVDSSKTSLKAVLLHKTNEYPSIPIAYSTEMKETYDTLKQILQDVQYEHHQWRISCDLKVVAILRGLQLGYIKYLCFMCLWDSRYKGNHYQKHDWSDRCNQPNVPANVIHSALVPRQKILMPPLHIKLGIVKNFIKTIVKRPEIFDTLKAVFPRLSEAKIKEGDFFQRSRFRPFTNFYGFFVKVFSMDQTSGNS